MTTATEHSTGGNATRAEQQPPTEGALAIYREILMIEVKDQESLGKMADLVKGLKTGIKAVEDWFEPFVKTAHDAHKALTAKRAETVAPLKAGAETGQKMIDEFLRAERRRQDEERRELERLAAEKAAKEKEELEKAAAQMEELGQGTAAAALRQDAERVVAAPALVPTVDRTVRTGASTVSAGKCLIVQVADKKAFLRYLVENNSEAVFVEFRQRELEAWVRANGIKAGQVPGLAVEETVKSSIR